MSGHPPFPAPRPRPAEAMTAPEVDAALSTLARCSTALLEESQAEQQRMEELNELSEAGIEQRAGDRRKWYDAECVLLSVRLRLAIRCANAHRDAAHQFVCWWVDAAMAAWKSAVHGTPVQYARLGAAAPDTLMLPDDMALLPDVDEHTRKMVELGAFLGTPPPGAAPDSDDGFAAMTTDLAARSGLSIRRNEMGGIDVVNDVDPEARRRRLWGDYWLDFGIPALPAPDELDVLLGNIPGESASRLLNASRAVVSAAMTKLRISELEDTEAPWTAAEVDEYEQLSAQPTGLHRRPLRGTRRRSAHRRRHPLPREPRPLPRPVDGTVRRRRQRPPAHGGRTEVTYPGGASDRERGGVRCGRRPLRD
ncbi:hypothetical protein ACFYO9_11170 [Streptomyces sp. NPDC005863]|uniref:hypothetical protein n=1 Tax=unclassified Streptomyces TaxID=2593676 RepID=UPI0033D1437B